VFQDENKVKKTTGLKPLLQYLYTPSAQGIDVEGREGREIEDCGPKLS
jgi:hypothetical protein